MKQLSMRHSNLVPKFDTGVPQGCPLSPLLFAGTIDHILIKLKSSDLIIDVIAFADDIVIVCKEGASKDVMKLAVDLFREIGLEIN